MRAPPSRRIEWVPINMGQLQSQFPFGDQTWILSVVRHWENLLRLPITENTVVRGDILVIEHNLRGFDATHLACALLWQETMGLPVTLASFDRRLIQAARLVHRAYLPAKIE
jgi:hypothetical protein